MRLIFSILQCDQSLVESNEDDLLPTLQEKINYFNINWNIPTYNLTDDLYTVSNLAVLFHQIPMWLLNIRLANCRTRKVHSFHIIEYLKSHGDLDKYIQHLTKKQLLFLYRNILYIENNIGKQETFEWLLQNILTDRGVGLAEFYLNHNLDDIFTNLRPTAAFTRTPLNKHHSSNRIENHTIESVLMKERGLARRNFDVEEETIKETNIKVLSNRRGRFPTKLLESTLIDREKIKIVTKTDFFT